MLSLMLAVLPACTRGGVRTGTALAHTNGLTVGIKVVPGDQWVLDLPDLHNISKAPITIRRITIEWTSGSSAAVRVNRVWMVPFDPSRVPGWVPGSVYKTLPPTIDVHAELPSQNGCYVQRLAEPTGYVIRPGVEARLAIWVDTVGAGHFRMTGPDVTYTRGGREFQQFLPQGVEGSSVVGGRPLPPDSLERGCLRAANVLPSGP